MGPRAGLDRCGKSRPPLGLDPRTVQPVASRYTDCTNAASMNIIKNISFNYTMSPTNRTPKYTQATGKLSTFSTSLLVCSGTGE